MVKETTTPACVNLRRFFVIVVAREAISKQYVNPEKPAHSHTPLGVLLINQGTAQEEPNG